MGLTTDDVARMTRIHPDERAFATERRRHRRRKPDPPPMPEGSCCGRCARWNAPPDGDDDRLGVCVALVVVTASTPYLPALRRKLERGEVLARDGALAWPHLTWEFLRTASGFACSGFDPSRPQMTRDG